MFSDYTEKLSSVRESSVQLSKEQLEVHLDQMLISSYYLSTAFSIDPAIKYFGSLVLFLCVNKHILNASFWTL